MFRGAEQELSFPPVLTQSSEPSQDLSNQSLVELNLGYLKVLSSHSGFLLFSFFAPCIVLSRAKVITE